MLLIGVGGGACLAPLTAFGIAGVEPADSGAASGLVNVTHQIGGSLGLGVLLVVSASPTTSLIDPKTMLAHQVRAALTAGSVMLALALIVVLVLIVQNSGPQRGIINSPSVLNGSSPNHRCAI